MTKEQFLHKLTQRYPRAEVVEVATVLWEGWEMDNHVALVRQDGQTRLVGSDHDRLCLLEQRDLREAIRRHRQATESCERVLAALDSLSGA